VLLPVSRVDCACVEVSAGVDAVELWSLDDVTLARNVDDVTGCDVTGCDVRDVVEAVAGRGIMGYRSPVRSTGGSPGIATWR